MDLKSRGALFFNTLIRPLERRQAHLLVLGLAEMTRCLLHGGGEPSESFCRYVREANRLGEDARSPEETPLAFALGLANRDLFILAENVLREEALFEVNLAFAWQPLTDRLVSLGTRLREAVDRAVGRGRGGRTSLESARRQFQDMRRLYEDSVEKLFRIKEPVTFLKRREILRQIWQMAQALSRVFHPLQDRLVSQSKADS